MTKEDKQRIDSDLSKLMVKQQLQYLVDHFPARYSQIVSSRPALLEEVIKLTPKLNDPKFKLKTRIYWVMHDLVDFPRCPNPLCSTPGGKVFDYNVGTDGYFSQCKECNNNVQSPRTKLTKQTNLERYGCISNMGTAKFKEDRKKTYLEHYGVDHNMKCEKGKREFEDAMVKKYGVKYFAQTSRGKEITTDRVEKARFEAIMCNDHVIPLSDPIAISKAKLHSQHFWWQCKDCGHVFAASMKSITNEFITTCPFCKFEVMNLSQHSYREVEVANFLREKFPALKIINCNPKVNRHIIPPKELDIWIPEKRIAIEFDGSFWHSVQFQSQYLNDVENTVMLKTQLCELKEIHVIHIFEDEWEFNRDKTCIDLERIIKGSYFDDVKGDQIVVSHAKFPPWLKIEGYEFSNFIDQNTTQRRNRKGKVYDVYDCGFMVFNKIQKSDEVNKKELTDFRGNTYGKTYS